MLVTVHAIIDEKRHQGHIKIKRMKISILPRKGNIATSAYLIVGWKVKIKEEKESCALKELPATWRRNNQVRVPPISTPHQSDNKL